MKKIFIFFVLLISLFVSVKAAEISPDVEDMYNEQLKMLDIDKIKSALPKESQNSLNNIGLNELKISDILNLKFENIVKEIIKETKNHISIFSVMPILAIIFLSAILKNFKTSVELTKNYQIIDTISLICISASIINPIVRFISKSSVVINAAANFTVGIVPVLSGIMIATGHTLSATSYHALVIFAGQAISYLSAEFLVPVMNTLLGISLVSCISPRINIGNLCLTIQKSIKTLLKVLASVFTGLLTLQNLVGNCADTLAKSTWKLTIDSCVPIVGGAVSDAVHTMGSCLNLLKTSLGAFGIIAGAVIFLPVIAECFLWMILLNICLFVSDIFELKKISALIKSTVNVISVLLAIIVCIITVLIVSIGIILIIGR